MALKSREKLNMDTRFTIRLTVPQDKNLSKWQRLLAAAVTEQLESEGLRVQLDGQDSHRLDDRFENTRQCQGVLVLGFAQWEAHRLHRDRAKSCTLPSEFVHIANAMAVAARKPLLVLKEKTVAARGSFKEGYLHPVVLVPHKATPEWLETSTFRDAFAEWLSRVREHRHVFLGYSSKARQTADTVRGLLESGLGLSILDWHDFPAGGVIIENMAQAERRARCGVFLFTKDDEIETAATRQTAPRDNVVFEAGLFSGAKGAGFTLILREQGAKVPTDLGGVVFLEFKRRSEIASLEDQVRQYFSSRLAG